MRIQNLRDTLEAQQASIYFGAVGAAVIAAWAIPGTVAFEALVNPTLALMLFVTFLQVPLAELGQAFARFRFLAALLVANFIAIPLLTVLLTQQLLPDDPVLRLGAFLVLLAPCIDYVVTFSSMGGANARLLLAATPALLIAQILLLPLYLRLLLGDAAAELVQPAPFVHAFLWLIVMPLALAALLQFWTARSTAGKRLSDKLALLPVLATAVVLFVVVAAVVPRMRGAADATLSVMPLYLAYAVTAPLVGWAVGRLFCLETSARRAVAFSAGTRNSLVVLPLAFSISGAVPILPAIIVTQTLVELFSEMVYVRVALKFGHAEPVAPRTS